MCEICFKLFPNGKFFCLLFQAGDQYLSGLATRYASELGMNEIDVLHQLDDLRQMMNTCNDLSQSAKNNYYNGDMTKSPDLSLTSPGLPHTYANVNSPYCGTSQRTFSPGVYAVSTQQTFSLMSVKGNIIW